MKTFYFLATLFITLSTFSFSWGKTPPKNIISYEQALKTVIQTHSGEIKSHELEFENNRWIYSFDIANSNGTIQEIQVDAKSGKVVSNKTETAKEEASEQKGEEIKSKSSTK